MTVHVLGGYQTDFARSWAREADNPLFDMLREAVLGALRDAEVESGQIQTAHVGNFGAEQFAGQSHLGGMVPMLCEEWSALPTSRHEAACASGSAAVLAAMAEIEAGRYDVALVVGVELMRNVPGADAARRLGSAAWVDTELRADVLPWPDLFNRIAEETDRRFGLDQDHLNAIARINRENARRNPNAQTRSWTMEAAQFGTEDEGNPLVVGRTRRSDCGRITDGASAVVLAGDGVLRGRRRRNRPVSRLSGWGHRTAPLPLADKLARSNGRDHLFPHVRRAITDAFGRAGITGPEQLDVIETHDCFTITEYLALDHFGLTEPGRAWEAVEDGRISFGGPLPVNPSGGLIGAGHPVGATGVRMVLDAHRQVTGTADGYQVAGARTAATLNLGGSATTAVSFVVAAE